MRAKIAGKTCQVLLCVVFSFEHNAAWQLVFSSHLSVVLMDLGIFHVSEKWMRFNEEDMKDLLFDFPVIR